MTKLTSKYYIIIALLFVTSVFSSILKYDDTQDTKSDLTNLQSIPIQIGNWTGKDFNLDKKVYEILETKAIVHRSYVKNNSDNIFMSIVHYNNTKVDFHAPETCLGGRGIKTSKTYQKLIIFPNGKERIISVAKIISKGDSNDMLTYYFYKSGDFIGSSYIKLRLNIAANKLSLNDTRGSLIRVSTNINNINEKETEIMLTRFIENLFPYIMNTL